MYGNLNRGASMKVSIIIPTYNEAGTIKNVLQRAGTASFGFEAEREIIVVDDGSSDSTRDILDTIPDIIIVRFEKNKGKGAAVKAGFLRSSGDIVLIQDADLEYNPADYPKLLGPLYEGRADVVYGSRFYGGRQRVLYFWHFMGNKALTLFSNIFTNFNLSDMETGYKAFRREVLDCIAPRLRSSRFGIEPELTARVAHTRNREGKQWRVYEVPIQYDGRTYEEGKKIGWKDGLKAILAILYFNIIDRG